MKSILLITDNPSNPELVEGAQHIEQNGFKIFIDETWPPDILEFEQQYDFSWIIIAFDNYDKYHRLSENIRFKAFLDNNTTPLKVVIREPYTLVSEWLDYNADVFSDWHNLIMRNFIVCN